MSAKSEKPIFPPEIWVQIYAYVVKYAESAYEISPLLLVDKLSYGCLQPCLCETANLDDTDRGWAVRRLLNDPSGTIPIKRVHVPFGTTIRAVHLVEPRRVLERCHTTIERLAYWLKPDYRTILSIRRLSRLTFLEMNVVDLPSVLFPLQPHVPILWLCSLTRLSLFCETSTSTLRELDSIDFTAFASLTQMIISSTQSAVTLATILSRPPPQLSLIVVFASMGYQRWTKDGTSSDVRVVYYERSPRSVDIWKGDKYLCERPCSDPGFDDPMDDWGELTHCRDLQFWTWATRAQRERSKIFTRPSLTMLISGM
ncbi:hypothetical protein DL96DRAFT_1682948 [Flagelloscypha sp. PMI_526]|nr:hypothetical protein DL96DRAFT_1682948 [Flagelloscypha sp. PMI_526]